MGPGRLQNREIMPALAWIHLEINRKDACGPDGKHPAFAGVLLVLNRRETFRADAGKRERAYRRAARARNVYG